MVERKNTTCDSHNRNWNVLFLVLFYNALITAGLLVSSPVLLPLIATKTKWRLTFRQRMGWSHKSWHRTDFSLSRRRIWVHALSVGEVLAAQPLIKKIRALHPDAQIIVTASTLTGFETAMRIFEKQSVRLDYFPYDLIWVVRRVAARINPTHVIVIETDIWPTFLWEMKQRCVPIYLVNLRLSNRTWRYYQRFKWIARRVYAAFDGVCVQTRNEMNRLLKLGVASERICKTGNFKFDGMTSPTDTDSDTSWRKRLNVSTDHKIIVAGSTHQGEETILCGVVASLLSQIPALRLVIAPRDPQRSRSVRTLCRQYDLQCELLSHVIPDSGGQCPQVVVVDGIGMLRTLYRIADIAVVGGSLLPFGGHNPLEPAFWAKPVLFGADMRDFALIADYLTAAGGAIRTDTAAQLKSEIIRLIENPEAAAGMGRNAMHVLRSHQGAVKRTLTFLNLSS